VPLASRALQTNARNEDWRQIENPKRSFTTGRTAAEPKFVPETSIGLAVANSTALLIQQTPTAGHD